VKKVYEIAFKTDESSDADPNDDYVVWIATDRKITSAPGSSGRYIKEIDVGITYPAGVDVIVE